METTVAIPEYLNSDLLEHLIRVDEQEDLVFCLWTLSEGKGRKKAVINRIIFPEDGDRQIHGNVSFNPQYFERVLKIAAKEGLGIAFLHSHPFPGFQHMSTDDYFSEKRMAGAVENFTDLPLLGLTVGNDGFWSGRFWNYSKSEKQYEPAWCTSINVVGKRLQSFFNDELYPSPEYKEHFKRTRNVWGELNHKNFSRLKIGIIGLGSVGSMVAECLARMGLQRFILIDFDRVEQHNLDRQIGSYESDIGEYKVDVAKRAIINSATCADVKVTAIHENLAKKEAYEAALDCDVLFSCVDRPRARSILNHFAYAHLIPVIDGGIKVSFNSKRDFKRADWQFQTATLGNPCLECLGVYNVSDVSTEIEGKLDDPSYMDGLPKNHHYKENENVFPFSMNLASFEILHLVELVSGIGGCDFGVQRFRYVPGMLDAINITECKKDCEQMKLIGQADRHFKLYDK